MRKIAIALSMLLFISEHSFAFESGQLSLDTPNVLNKGEGSFGIRHRFYGEAKDTNSFLGADEGGNMFFSLKYGVLDKLLIGVEHNRVNHEYSVGMEYSQSLNMIGNVALKANGFTITDFSGKNRKNSFFVNSAYQSPNFFEHIIITTNLGYDNYYEKPILGFGIDMNMQNSLTWLTFTEKLSFLAEYYPQIGDDIQGITGKDDAYAFGIKFQTFGHHFEVMLSNSTNLDAKGMALGTNSEVLHIGFNINRKF